MNSPAREPIRLSDVLRFVTELIAWIGTPWALARYSVLLAIASVLLLIGLPTVFGTPGDKERVIVAVPGWGTIALVLLQVAGALFAAWLLLPVWAAVAVSAPALACVVTEQPRWRRLLNR